MSLAGVDGVQKLFDRLPQLRKGFDNVLKERGAERAASRFETGELGGEPIEGTQKGCYFV